MFDECKMPDLSELDPLIPAVLVQILAGEPGLSREQGLVRRNFVRLTDRAIAEYARARQAWIDQSQEGKRPSERAQDGGRVLHILAFTDHLETCFYAVNRLLSQLDRMGRYFAVDRITRGVIDSARKDTEHVRDGLEHLDEWLERGEIAEGQPIMLMISDDGESAVFGGHKVKFEDVALLIRRLHQIGCQLLGIKN